MSVILLCTWTIQHLNVPVQVKPKTDLQIFWRKLSNITRKLRWMLITIIGPEIILGKAIVDLWAASYNKTRMKGFAEEDGVEWSLTHAFFANMGGFVVEFPPANAGYSSPLRRSPSGEDVEARVIQAAPEVCQTKTSTPTEQVHDNAENAGLEIRELHGSLDGKHDHVVVSRCEAVNSVMGMPVVRAPSDSADDDARNAQDSDSTTHDEQRRQSTHDVSHPSLISDMCVVEEHGRTGLTESKTRSRQPSHRSEPINPLDTALRSWLDRRLHSTHRRTNLQACARNASQHSARGDIRWSIDPTNVATILRAMSQITKSEVILISKARFYDNLLCLQGTVWGLDAEQLLLSRSMGIIDCLHKVSEDELSDQSKGDFFIKGLAILQVTWLIIQLIARLVEHLAISQLEISVLAFAVCALFTWLLHWSKPQDVGTPRYIKAKRHPTPDEVIALAMVGPQTLFRARYRYWIPNNAFSRCRIKGRQVGVFSLCSAFVASVFGALHCLAWNLAFPTPVERLLWRVAAILTTGIPPASVALNMGMNHYFFGRPLKKWLRVRRQARTSMMVIWALVYVLARLYITVEVFRALAYLPPSAYRTTWSANFPHLN